jgi:hypothetical protein
MCQSGPFSPVRSWEPLRYTPCAPKGTIWRPCQGRAGLGDCERGDERSRRDRHDGQVGTQQENYRATALRPRRLVGRDREIAEVIESVVCAVDHGDRPGWRGQDGTGAGRGGSVGGAVPRWCVRRLAGLVAVGRAHRRGGGRTGRDAEVRRSVLRRCAHPLARRT